MKKVKFGLSRTKESTIVEFVCALMFVLVVILDIIILRRGTESFMDFFCEDNSELYLRVYYARKCLL